MSVRKEYSVIVGGDVVFSGSYAMACSVYESFVRFRDFFCDGDVCFPDISISFKPVLKSGRTPLL